MAGHGFLDLGTPFGDRICFSRDDAHGDDARRSGGKRSGAGVGSACKAPKTGIDTLGEADFDLE